MQRFLTLCIAVTTLLCGNLAFAATPLIPNQVHYPKDTLTIATKKGPVKITVEVATTEMQIEHGLMFRKTVPPMTGMIFLFPANRSLDMWMKNTLVSLDMFFLDEHGVITGIAEHTTPQSEAIIHSDYDAKAVLEMVAGSAKSLNIAKGDKLVYPTFH